MLKVVAAIALLTLTACSSPAGETAGEPDKPPAQSAADAVAKPKPPAPRVRVQTPLILAPDGLLLADHAGKMQLLPYGTERIKAESAVAIIVGTPVTRGSSSECGAGTVDYTDLRDGLQMTFQNGKFAGWTINAPRSPYKTAKGIGIGSTRQELDAAYGDLTVEDSSLGLLFSSGDLRPARHRRDRGAGHRHLGGHCLPDRLKEPRTWPTGSKPTPRAAASAARCAIM